jgi:hypothetical protein
MNTLQELKQTLIGCGLLSAFVAILVFANDFGYCLHC